MIKVTMATQVATNASDQFTRPYPGHSYAEKGACETDNGHRAEATTDLNLFLEEDRLKTFTDWSYTTVCPEVLSKAGFYCLHNQDKVKCPFCGVILEQWVAGDDPADDHIKWAPGCTFVRSKLQQNTAQAALDRAAPADEDVCGKFEYCPNSSAETLPLSLLSRLGIEKVMKSTYPLFSTYDSRVNSFSEWPKSLKQKPNELAEAGFFYNGVGDQTKCFYCGGGLRDWEEGDNPWEQHALHFPKCGFVLLKKHPDFVKQVQAKAADDKSVPSTSFNNLTTKEEIGESEDHRTHSHSSSSSSGSSSDEGSITPLCKICYKNELNVVFLPCRHQFTCIDCALALKNICPVCRRPFEGILEVFLS